VTTRIEQAVHQFTVTGEVAQREGDATGDVWPMSLKARCWPHCIRHPTVLGERDRGCVDVLVGDSEVCAPVR